MLGNVATNLALHTAVMSSMNANRYHSGGGHITGFEACMGILLALYITYIFAGVLFGLIIGDVYDSKKQFILDLLIPFRGVYRVIKNQFKELN